MMERNRGEDHETRYQLGSEGFISQLSSEIAEVGAYIGKHD